jgi:hypothetical protein
MSDITAQKYVFLLYKKIFLEVKKIYCNFVVNIINKNAT